MAIRAVVFDAYGTLFDVYSVAALAERYFHGQGDAISRLWRERQIDYTRLRTLSGRYEPFSVVTRDALSYTLAKLGLDDATGGASHELLACYRELAIFPENVAVLEKLRGAGLPLGILSNGDEEMLHAVIRHNQVETFFTEILSCDRVRRFKTAPETYRLVTDAFGCNPDEVVFVSSNCWDACGAAWFGFSAFWVNRAGDPVEVLDARLSGQAKDMTPLLDFVQTISQTN
jgi:2-haloacid dehalogenase